MIRHDEFLRLSNHVLGRLESGEDATLWLQSEASDFVRFNHGQVRQPGTVHQGDLTLRLIRGQRHASLQLSLGGEEEADRARLDQALDQLRELVRVVPEDPHLLWATDGESSMLLAEGQAPDAARVTADVLEAVEGDDDFVGILVSGQVGHGFASSRGQRCWDQRHSLLLDWCLYHQGDKAVKSTLGSTGWDPAEFALAMDAARGRLELLSKPAKRLSPGRHRCFLAPAAVAELLDLLGWGGFGLRAQRTHNTPLLPMLTRDQRLSPLVSLWEDTRHGLGASFTADGFHKPDSVPLVEQGRLVGSLVSPRSAREYGLETNGASSHEGPEALVMDTGELADEDILDQLGTGLYVSNLWYLNYSDRPAGRITGMTRFATMWVEDGQVVAPTEVMRFDETIFHLLGSGLEGLTDSLALLPSTSTYDRRSTASVRVPGALIDGVSFTL